MRIEILILGITGLVIFNLYTDGKYLNMAMKWTKYYKMIGIALAGLFLCYLIRKNPLSAGTMLNTTNEYLKYMPLDKNTSKILNPILDFTSKQQFGGGRENNVLPVQHMQITNQERKLMTSGNTPAAGVQKVKRSVSETKKKFVASRQGWKCGDCHEQLNAWFEVDHKTRLEHGGSNHIDNLVALCRECHGKKTTIENL
jgi:5-methylcytosine-specific restriction endonuclease McrA